MYDPRMQEDWHDEAKPLIRSWLRIEISVHYRIGHAAETAELGQLTCRSAVCLVWARPKYGCLCVLDLVLVAHTGHIASAHVDEDVW